MTKRTDNLASYMVSCEMNAMGEASISFDTDGWQELYDLLKELCERRKIRHPDEIKLRLELERKKPIIGSMYWRRVLRWVLSPDKEEKA